MNDPDARDKALSGVERYERDIARAPVGGVPRWVLWHEHPCACSARSRAERRLGGWPARVLSVMISFFYSSICDVSLALHPRLPYCRSLQFTLSLLGVASSLPLPNLLPNSSCSFLDIPFSCSYCSIFDLSCPCCLYHFVSI
jgi:hypothetical protein